MRKETYFVVSECEEPTRIFFNFKSAKESGITYIDSFDEDGKHFKAYKLDQHNLDYTTDF